MTRLMIARTGVCLFQLLILLSAPLQGRFRLLNPGSPVYYRYAVISGERIKIVAGTRVSGNVHSNGDVSIASGALIDGVASAVGKITGPGTVTGTKREGTPSASLPRPATASEFPAMADRISVVSLGSITLVQDRSFRGFLYAGQDVQVGRGAQLEGVVLAGRRAHLNGDVRLTFVNFDSGPPSITLQSPTAGAFLPTAISQITLSFSDDLSGADPSTASFFIDGQDHTAVATVSRASKPPRSFPSPPTRCTHAADHFSQPTVEGDSTPATRLTACAPPDSRLCEFIATTKHTPDFGV